MICYKLLCVVMRCYALLCVTISYYKLLYKLLWYFVASAEVQESGLLRGTVRVGMRVLMLHFLPETLRLYE